MREVYQSVDEELFEGRGSKEVLKNFLRENTGKFFTASKLSEECSFTKSNTQVELRKAITELIEEGNPIVGNVKGFSWATCPEMISFYIESLNHRVLGIQRRIKALQKIKNKMEE